MSVLRWLFGVGLLAAAVAQPRLLLSPLFLALILAWLGVTALAAARPRWAAAAWSGLALMLVLMTPAAANTLLSWMEVPAQPLVCSAEPDRIHVLLTGGTERDPTDATDYGALGADSLARTTRFARQFAQGDARSIVISGGGVGLPESGLMAALLTRSDVAAQRLRTETASLDTWASAHELRRQMPELGTRIVLSTSALHQRRASLAFRAHGFDVCDNALFSDVIAPGPLASFVPQSTSLRKSERVLHEVVGWLVYRLRS